MSYINLSKTMPNGMERLAYDNAILAQYGLLHRRKRYGKVIRVNKNPSLGKDTNIPDALGNTMDNPLLTLAAAVSYCDGGDGDIILLEPSAYMVSTTYTTPYVTEEDVSIAVEDLTILGLGDPYSDEGLKSDAACTAAILSVTAAGKNLLIKNVKFDTTTGLQAAVKLAASADYPKFDGCVFTVVGTTGPTGYGIYIAGACKTPVITNCHFKLGTLVAAGIALTGGATGGLIQKCDLVSVLNGSGTGCVSGIDVLAGTGVIIDDCDIHGGDPATAYNMGIGINITAGSKNTMITGPCHIGNCDAGVTDGGTDSIGETAGEGWVDTTHA